LAGLVKHSIQNLLIVTVQKNDGSVKNAPEGAWKALIRTLSGYHQTPIWRQLMATTTNAVDRAARLIVGPRQHLMSEGGKALRDYRLNDN
jgi:hypothetical protein